MAAQTSFDRCSPRAVITLADLASDPDARHGSQDTSMADRALDRALQLLLATGHVAGLRVPGDGWCRWEYVRLCPKGMEAVGAWPPPAERGRLPTGCSVWDGRDAPLLGYVAASGPLAVVACAPTDAAPGARYDCFGGFPVTRIDTYWSLLALRDAELVSGADLGAAGWRDVTATAAGRDVARQLR